SDFERMLSVVHGHYVLPSQVIPDFSPALEQVIRTALALDPAHRYPSAAAMIEALEAVAMLEGWTLGTNLTQRMMRELYGTVTEPWATASADEITYVCPPPIPVDDAPAPQPTKVITRPRRFARGTECDFYEEPQPSDWQDDDAPTRGRRSLGRFWAAA